MKLKIKVSFKNDGLSMPWCAEVKGPWWSRYSFISAYGNSRDEALNKLQRYIKERETTTIEIMKVNW